MILTVTRIPLSKEVRCEASVHLNILTDGGHDCKPGFYRRPARWNVQVDDEDESETWLCCEGSVMMIIEQALQDIRDRA